VSPEPASGVIPVLSTHGLTAAYGDAQALFGIDVVVAPGETVAIIGSNGAGKSTFLRTVTGFLPAPAAAVRFMGTPIGGLPPHRIAAAGIALVPEGRRLFPSLSVEENLLAGAYAGRPGSWTLDRVYAIFPPLAERRKAPAPALSGGLQQMAAIGRALMANPTLLLCDEISLGLAPVVIGDLYRTLGRLAQDGLTVVVVEQDVATARRVSGRLYCFQSGRVSLAGRSDALTPDQISRAYFGLDR
jgi:branched-chain amino acid transport system ATP-binding protein